MSLRQQWNIADPSMVEDDNQVLSMCGIFGEDHTRFKSNIEARNFGEEVFEFDMELNGIKRFEKVGTGKTLEDLLDHIKDMV